jgi:ABC-type branched-subunit amino acid transport system substrate-binding protein
MRLPQRIGALLRAASFSLGAMLIAALAAGCGTSGGSAGPPVLPPLSGGGSNGGAVKVALLLPITGAGNTPSVAKALKQAAELALFDFNNPSVTLVPKDTHGTPAGARAAAESAISEGVELIIGPLFAGEVSSAAPVARQAKVPMIALSSDQSVAGNGVYLLSFLAGRDVPRIVAYAMSHGKRSFAVLVPQSPYGRVAEEAFARAVARSGGQASVRATFPPGDAGAMAGSVRQVGDAVKSGQKIDAVFLPAGPEDLQALSPLLASAGIAGRAQMIGTGQWDYPGIGREQALVGGWYAAPDPKGWSNFSANYAKTYGATPPRIASLGYDAVSLAVTLSQNQPGQRFTPSQLTRASGFSGVDGLFRLLPDGTSERGLAILEVGANGPRMLEPAPSSFTAAQY